MSGSLFSPAQYAEVLKVLNKESVAPSEPNAPTINMAGISPSSPCLTSQWIIDSGASDHMTGKDMLVRDSKSCVVSNGSVQLPNGSRTTVQTLGSVDISPTLSLHKALHVPAFTSNLLSVSKFIQDHHRFILIFAFFRTSGMRGSWGLVRKGMVSITLLLLTSVLRPILLINI